MKNKYKIIGILNSLTMFGVLFINYLAVTLPLNNKSTGELADSYSNLFVPAGLTFSIWGILYLTQIIFTVYYLISVFKTDKETPKFPEQIGWYFIIINLLNMSWIFAWHYQKLLLSLLVMIGLLSGLILIYIRLKSGLEKKSSKNYFLVQLPFSLYLGWITVATVANVVSLLVYAGWGNFGINPVIWTVIVIVVCLALTLINNFKRKDIAYSLVIIWALIGIILKRTRIDPEYTKPIIITSYISIGVIVISNILTRLKTKNKR